MLQTNLGLHVSMNNSAAADALALASYMGLDGASLRAVGQVLGALPPSALGRPLRRRRDGRGFLQDAFVRLHRNLFETGLLPLSRWGEGRDGGLRTSTISRPGFIRFIREQAWRVAPNSMCLGWDDTRYVDALVPNCNRSRTWVFSFVNRRGKPHTALANNAKRVLKADLRSGLDDAMLGPANMNGRFALILCNQVFEHVSAPAQAARSLFSLLAPGGIVLWTAPFAEIYHRAPEDYFRFTCPGAKHLFTSAGFEIVQVQKIGDTMITTGWLMGFGNGDFTAERLRAKLLNNVTSSRVLDSDPQERLYVSCALVLRRPMLSDGAAAQQQGQQQQQAGKTRAARRLLAPSSSQHVAGGVPAVAAADAATRDRATASARLLVGVLSFGRGAGRYRLERREWLRRLCPSRPPAVQVRFVMAADDRDTDADRSDVWLYPIASAGKGTIRKLLLQNAFFRDAVAMGRFDFIARADDDAAFNASEVSHALAAFAPTLPAGSFVAYGPFEHFYSWDHRSMEAACWSFGFRSWQRASYQFRQRHNASVEPRSLPPTQVHACLRTEGPFPFAAGPLVAYSRGLARRILDALGDAEEYVLHNRSRTPLVHPVSGRLVPPGDPHHPSRQVFKEEVLLAYLIWRWLRNDSLVLVHAPLTEWRTERKPMQLIPSAIVFHRLSRPERFELLAERGHLRAQTSAIPIECDGGSLGGKMQRTQGCCQRWRFCWYRGLGLPGKPLQPPQLQQSRESLS